MFEIAIAEFAMTPPVLSQILVTIEQGYEEATPEEDDHSRQALSPR